MQGFPTTENGNTPLSNRVLVVDDERAIADSLTLILQRDGLEAMAVYNGEDAITTARTFLPDVLIADYHMPPGIDGIETAVAIRSFLPGCQIVMLSGHSLTEVFVPYAKRGYSFLLLSKPLHPQELLAKIHGATTLAAEFVTPVFVLNVDDTDSYRYSLSRLLTHAGFKVSEAANGTDAIRLAIDLKPDLVLLDIHMPDKDGYDVCKALKENSETSGIKVLHLTAAERNSLDAMRSAAAGADDYLAQPIAPNALVYRVRELIQLGYLQQCDQPPNKADN